MAKGEYRYSELPNGWFGIEYGEYQWKSIDELPSLPSKMAADSYVAELNTLLSGTNAKLKGVR